MNADHQQWWSNLRHGGLLLDVQRLTDLVPFLPEPLPAHQADRLRREILAFQDDPDQRRARLVSYVLGQVCGFDPQGGRWLRGSSVPACWTRHALTGEAIRPNHLWLGPNGATLPVFIDDQPRLGVGRGRRTISQVLHWLRRGGEQLALLTNGWQWRIVFAGLDYDAFCQWDVQQWFREGDAAPELDGLRALLAPRLWTPPQQGKPCPLLAAVNDSRKGQAELSQLLGERVRQAVELLIEGHAQALNRLHSPLSPSDIYRAAVRMVMRLVVILFAESRPGLLPHDNPIYHDAYSLGGLREQLERSGRDRLANSFWAYPRMLALMRLIYEGCSHEAMPVPAYDGDLFRPGDPHDADGMQRALHLMETACFQYDILSDRQVLEILNLLSRTQMRIRQGRAAAWVAAPVDFSSLDSEYIGILYEGLLDFQLRCAAPDEPIVFLAVGDQPALPLATLEAMDDSSIKNLFEKLKKQASADLPGDEDSAEDQSDADEQPESIDQQAEQQETAAFEEDRPMVAADVAQSAGPEAVSTADRCYTFQARAESWARRACQAAGLVEPPRGRPTPERQMHFQQQLDAAARRLISKVVLPGQWYLVRWGGTRKGSGSFYTRPQLAIPTAHRTLFPLAYQPPTGPDGQPNPDAPADQWTPKTPEQILALKVCDPACGSGSFLLAALRFLTNALYDSLIYHGRIGAHGGRAVIDLIRDEQTQHTLASEALPCPPDDEHFEPRTKALLRRYVVERCIYGVDLDPLAVELARLSLWIETLDPHLPMTFLDHKIKVGNSLVGTWFDQFLHYPVMAWMREAGDANHTNGVNFGPGQFSRDITQRLTAVKQELLALIDGSRFPQVYPVDLTTVRTGHDAAERALREIHELGVAQVAQRRQRYLALRASPDFRRLKDAFDLWCAIWFWPPEQIELCPLPQDFAAANISQEAWLVVRQLAARHRFFHWELEFPDVFNAACGGFDAVLGNPPWNIAKPNSKEFFSAFDPLYRSYGKQEAIRKQTEYFRGDAQIERQWLDYCAYFKAMSNWVKYAGFPFGDRVSQDSQGRKVHDFNLGDRGRSSFQSSQLRHERWRAKREQSTGYADAQHPFRHQGSADINTYKLFLEQAHALLRDGGRMGLLVPSGLYSDYGSKALRELFLDRCRWEWLFGFENREKIFDIDSRFKFNPVVIEKGGHTAAIRTAFMRRRLADWEQAEELATPYPRQRVRQFSPNSLALLEIQSQRDLEVLTKIYSNSVLLGEQSERGWGIKYAREFDMTNDSHLFPPRTTWEQWGYRPDEYSRWIKGPWKPIDELWKLLGVDPARPQSAEIELEDWLFDTSATAEERARRFRRLHGHTLRPGDVARSDWRLRCAQPPYDALPIPRADIPPGIILSRQADAWIREDEIPIVTFTDAQGRPLKIKRTAPDGKKQQVEVRGPAIALPLYQGMMIWQLDPAFSGYERGPGNRARWTRLPWERKIIQPQFLLASALFNAPPTETDRWVFRDISNATNERSFVTAIIPRCPAGNTIAVLHPEHALARYSLAAVGSTLTFDWAARCRMTGTHLNYFIVEELPLLRKNRGLRDVGLVSRVLCGLSPMCAPTWVALGDSSVRPLCALCEHERMRLRTILEALVGSVMGLDSLDVRGILEECDFPTAYIARNNDLLAPKGFWRVDKDKPPELRQTVLALVAFHDLQQKIEAAGGDVENGIAAFLNQNDGEGWMLPETLRLADYGLGHDERARHHQPVRACFGPRFYDWQLVQSVEESWRECHLHARNLLGQEGYRKLLVEILTGGREACGSGRQPPVGQQREATLGYARAILGQSGYQRLLAELSAGGAPADPPSLTSDTPPGMLFDTGDMPLFGRKEED